MYNRRPLEEIAESGLTQADRLLDLYHNQWGGNVDAYYTKEFLY